MDGVQVEFEFAAPLELLWRALTERAKIAGWWGENDFIPQVGHRFTVSAIGLAALPGPVECTITELDPERRLVMGWRVGTTRATVSMLAEATESGSRLVVTRHGAIGPVTPVDLDQALHNLFDVRLRAVLSRVPVGVGAPSGSIALPDGTPGSPVAPGRSGPGPRRPRLGRPGARPVGPPRPGRIWPVISIVIVVAIIAVAVLLGSLGFGGGGSGTGSALGPIEAPGGLPGSGAAAPADAASGAPGSGTGGGQPGQTNQPAGTVPTTAAGPVQNPPPLTAHMTASFRVVAQRLTSFDVTVTVANSGGASGQWTSVAAALTGLNLQINVLSSAVSYVLRHDTNCFLPAGSSATVAPGASVTFTFTVSALANLLGTISSVALDSPSCA
jgi:uncharacterized protein YndB with AHSA1/START domain